MIVPVMAISNLVLAQQIYSEGANGEHAHNRDRVPLSVQFLIGVQQLGTNCQIKRVRWWILLALNSRYPRI